MNCADSFESMAPRRGVGRAVTANVNVSAIDEMIVLLEQSIIQNGDAFNRLALKMKPALSEDLPRCAEDEKKSGRFVSSELGVTIMQLTAKLNGTTVEMNHLADRVEL